MALRRRTAEIATLPIVTAFRQLLGDRVGVRRAACEREPADACVEIDLHLYASHRAAAAPVVRSFACGAFALDDGVLRAVNGRQVDPLVNIDAIQGCPYVVAVGGTHMRPLRVRAALREDDAVIR